MECANIQEQLSAYLDNILSSAEKETIDNHLNACPKCRKDLADLEKTVRSIRSIEEVIPPPWLAQKIMSRIKTEAERREKGLFQKLFFPLHIKLPFEAVGIFLIAITALYVFKHMEPEIRSTKTPSDAAVSEFSAQQKSAPADSIGKQPSEVAPFKQFKKIENTPPETPSVPESKSLPAMTAEQRTKEKDFSLKEKSPEHQKQSEKTLMMRSAPSPAGVRAYDELKKEEPTLESGKDAAGLFSKEDISLSIKTDDINSAKTSLREILSNLGGRVMKEEATSGSTIIVGELSSDNLSPFMQKIKVLGYVNEGLFPPLPDKDQFLIKITVIK